MNMNSLMSVLSGWLAHLPSLWRTTPGWSIAALTAAVVAWIVWRSRRRWRREIRAALAAERLEPPAPATRPRDGGNGMATRKAELLATLRQNGHRARDGRPWLVVVADDALAQRFFPGLSARGFVDLDDAVMIHAGDATDAYRLQWLREVARLRGRRRHQAVLVLTMALHDPSGRTEANTASSHYAEALRWRAPVYVLDMEEGVAARAEPALAAIRWYAASSNATTMDACFRHVHESLTDAAFPRSPDLPIDDGRLRLSRRVAGCAAAATDWLVALGNRHGLHGVAWVEIPASNASIAPSVLRRFVLGSALPAGVSARGRRYRTFAWIVATLGLAATAVLGVRFQGEREQLRTAAAWLRQAESGDADVATRALLRWQALSAEVESGWAERVRPRYDLVAQRWLVAPVQRHLTSRLARAPRLEDLSTYLWLAHPEKAEATALAAAMLATGLPRRPAGAQATPGEWHDRLRQLHAFHAERIAGHGPGSGTPPIKANEALVARARKVLGDALVGPYAADAIHVRMLETQGEGLAPVTLDTLVGGRAAGLLVEGHPLPGLFTRKAWDERVRPAIDAAVNEASAADGWVLHPEGAGEKPTEALRRALRERYLDAFAEAWRDFLNDLRWQEAPTLEGVAGQLAVLSHPSRSPLPALFAAMAREASTAAPLPAVANAAASPVVAAALPEGPLAAFFAPLTAHAPAADGRDDAPLSLHMRRLADVHAHLQSLLLEDDPGDASRLASRAMRRGTVSSLGEGRALAASLAAGLGQEWTGFGNAVFRKPVEAAARAGLVPVAPSVNAEWRATVAADWQRDLADRYPFVASEHDASMAALSRLLHPEHGAIGKFVATRLDGVIERQGDHWRAVPGASRVAPPVDPAFIEALDRLTQSSNVLFAAEGGVRFALRSSPVDGVEEVRVDVPGGGWRYFNQREAWHSLVWPLRDGAPSLQMAWRPPGAALRETFAAEGPFAILRWLEQAELEGRDGPVFRLRFARADVAVPTLRLQLRGEDGDGPMALLALRGLVLPERIFVESESTP
jgi:type VI secretion system protein ImpL